MKDGGPAFPGYRHNVFSDGSEQVGEHTFRVPGMSLRDWFAGMALSGMYADNQRAGTWEERAEWAYAAADAMLAEREKGEPND